MVDLEEIRKIEDALQQPSDRVHVNKFKLNLTTLDFSSLCGINWLTDNIINFYMELICERNRQKLAFNDTNYRKVTSMNVFFYGKLRSHGYDGVKTWTRKKNLFDYDMVLIPIHESQHWTLATIDMKNKCICNYDSLHGMKSHYLTILHDYLKRESSAKGIKDIQWQLQYVTNSPQQKNGSDCGVFTCITAEHLTRKASLSFSQEDMPYYRRRMLLQTLLYQTLDC